MFFGGKRKKKFELSGCVVTGGSNQNIEFWDINNGTRVTSIQSRRYTHYCFDFIAPNLCVCGTDQTALIIDLKKKSIEKELNGHTSYIWNIVAFSKNRFATCGGDSTCRIWSTKKNQPIHTFRHTSGNLRGVRPLKSLKERVCSVGSDGVVKIWNLRKAKEETQLNPTPHGQLWDLEESVRRRALIVAGYTNPYLYYYDLRALKKKHKTSSRLSQYVCTLLNVPDYNEIWAGCNDGYVYIFDHRKLTAEKTKFRPHNSTIYRIKRMGGSKFKNVVATGGVDYNLRLWDIKKVRKGNGNPSALKDIRTQTYCYGISYLGKTGGNDGGSHLGFTLDLSGEVGVGKMREKRLKYIRDLSKRFEYVKEQCFSPSDSDLLFQIHDETNTKIIKELPFKKYWFSHCEELLEKIKNNKDLMIINEELEIDQDLLIKFLLIKKRPVLDILFGDSDEINELFEDDEKEDSDDEDEEDDPFADGEDDDEDIQSLEMFFTLKEKRKFLDYFMFFKTLGLKHEMLSVLYQVSRIKKLELLLLLFLRCVRKYENMRIKRMFLPHDEIEAIEREEKEKLKKKEEEEAEGENEEEEKKEEEEEYDDFLIRNLEDRLKNERKAKEEKLRKREEKRRKRMEKRKKMGEDYLSSDEEDSDDEEDEDTLDSKQSNLFGKVMDGLDDEETLVGELKEQISFSTSFCLFIFHLMKEREEEIRSNSRLLKYFVQVLELLEKGESIPLISHMDFKDVKVELAKAVKSRRKGKGLSKSEFLVSFNQVMKEKLFKSKEMTNLTIQTIEKPQKFPVHKELAILRSPFLYSLIKEQKTKDVLEVKEIDGEQMKLLVQFIYQQKITSSPSYEVVFRLMNHAFADEDSLLLFALMKFLRKEFSKMKKLDVVNLIVKNGYLLESDELQNKFSKDMDGLDFPEEDDEDAFESKEIQIIFHRSMKKFKVDKVIKELKEENQALKKKNEQLEQEVKELKEKLNQK